jgi:hypothetical protein
MEQVVIEYRGKQITATLSRGPTGPGAVPPGQGKPMWHVAIGGTALTRLPARQDDTEKSVRDRVVQWLDQHPDMLDRDQIVLGGG